MHGVKTVFVDIDGTIWTNFGMGMSIQLDLTKSADILPGVKGKFDEWEHEGTKIILTTGRKECYRAETEAKLKSFGLYWDQLVMECGGGPRILINDKKPNGELTAFAVNLDRNVGLSGVKE